MHVAVVQADITTLDVDAIVNAANETLLGGGGVDGAIHRAAGPELLAACRALPEVRPGVRCPTGAARLTPGFRLRARWVIHTVGPVWRGGTRGEAELLAACYRESVALARAQAIASLAFPAISCGVYGYPAEAAARIALATLREELAETDAAPRVLLCGFGAAMAATFRAAADALGIALAD
ncbi:MAG TPA: O-acetyl-ADP-ribose deacetylase [Mizugakiibacter sp.]